MESTTLLIGSVDFFEAAEWWINSAVKLTDYLGAFRSRFQVCNLWMLVYDECTSI